MFGFCLFVLSPPPPPQGVCMYVYIYIYAPGCPETCFKDQDGHKLRDPPAFVSRVLGLELCIITAGYTEWL